MANSNKKSKKNAMRNDLSETQVLEIIEKQPESVQESIARTLVAEHVSYQGPIPPPELLSQFDDIIPDGANRIMIMAEEQSKHRREIEANVVNANNRDSLLGVVFAGIMGLLAIVGSIWLISINKSAEGLSVIIGAVGSLWGIYLKGMSQDDKDLKKKQK